MKYNIEAEQYVLGCLLIEGDLLENVTLQPSDFYERAHKIIFKAMQCLQKEGENVDIGSVTTFIAQKQQLESVNGIQYLSKLANSIPSTANLNYYVSIVTERSLKRKAAELMAQMQTALAEDCSLDELKELSTGFQDLTVGKKSNGQTANDVLVMAYDEIEKRQAQQGSITGVATGYYELDMMTSGLQSGDYIVIGARPSLGKTALALNLVNNMTNDQNVAVDVYSLEMEATKLMDRQLASEGGVNFSRIRNGNLQEKDWDSLTMAMGTIGNKDIVYYDKMRCTVEIIRENTKQRRKDNPDKKIVILIDYLQLMSYVGPNKNKNEEVSYISRELKSIANEFKATVIALSQLSRGVEQRQDKRPMMSDIRDSGSVEQDADMIGVLYRDDYYDKESENKNIIELIIAKQRNGAIGTVQLYFDKDVQSMVNLNKG